MTLDEKLALVKTTRASIKTALGGKEFKNLNTAEKDMILEAVAKILGLI